MNLPFRHSEDTREKCLMHILVNLTVMVVQVVLIGHNNVLCRGEVTEHDTFKAAFVYIYNSKAGDGSSGRRKTDHERV